MGGFTMSVGKPIDIKGDNDLLSLLRRADPDELGVFVDYLTDSEKGRLSLSNDVCATLVEAKSARVYPEAVIRTMIRELQLFGGNSIVNLFRSGGVQYSEILFDVLEHLKGSRDDGDSVADIEVKVLKKLWGLTLEGVPREQRAELLCKFASVNAANDRGSDTLSMAQLLSNAMAASSFGIAGGAAAGVGFASTRAVSTMLGPIGLALSGVWGTYNLTSAAYRVTVPCVVLIAYLRLRLDA